MDSSPTPTTVANTKRPKTYMSIISDWLMANRTSHLFSLLIRAFSFNTTKETLGENNKSSQTSLPCANLWVYGLRSICVPPCIFLSLKVVPFSILTVEFHSPCPASSCPGTAGFKSKVSEEGPTHVKVEGYWYDSETVFVLLIWSVTLV